MYSGRFFVKYSTGNKGLSQEELDALYKGLNAKFPGSTFERGGQYAGNALSVSYESTEDWPQIEAYLTSLRPKLAISRAESYFKPDWTWKDLGAALTKIMPKRLTIEAPGNNLIWIKGGKFSTVYNISESAVENGGHVSGHWLHVPRGKEKVDLRQSVDQVAEKIRDSLRDGGMLQVSLEDALDILEKNGIAINEEGQIRAVDVEKVKKLLSE